MNQHIDISCLTNNTHHQKLIATILGSDTEKHHRLARHLLRRFGGITGIANADPSALLNVEEMTMPQIERLMAAIQLGRCMSRSSISNTKIDTPEAAYSVFKPVLTGLIYEEMHALYLNNSKRLLLHRRISSGSKNMTIAEPRQIIGYALQIHADEIILGHNHPSGDPSPSKQDIVITQRIAMSALLMGVTLIDHIIVAGNGYSSFCTLGELPVSSEALSFFFSA